MDLIRQAQQFATQKHVLDNHQLYAMVLPYTHHLQAVYDVLLRFGCRYEPGLVAAWLHDIVEDTRGRPNEVRVRDIEESFGQEIANLVAAVTSEEGPNRKTRNALTYPKIRALGGMAIALKLADRIANVEYAGGARQMYAKEHAEFRHALFTPKTDIPNIVDLMWVHLDGMIEHIEKVAAVS